MVLAVGDQIPDIELKTKGVDTIACIAGISVSSCESVMAGL